MSITYGIQKGMANRLRVHAAIGFLLEAERTLNSVEVTEEHRSFDVSAALVAIKLAGDQLNLRNSGGK